MHFPYVEFLGLHEDRIFRPMIPVTFKVEKEIFKTYALVDSGADYSILPIEIAGKLNLRLDPQMSHRILGAGGNSFKVYKSPTEIEQIIKKSGFRDLKWQSHIYFAESSNTILLGQNGYLNKFKVTLNGTQRQIEITN
jgi:hypothetical protein